MAGLLRRIYRAIRFRIRNLPVVRRLLRRLNADPVKRKYGDRKDFDGYKKIRDLVPEINSYKDSTILHITDLAGEAGCADLNEYAVYLTEHEEKLEMLRSSLTLKGSHFFRGNDWDFFRDECLSAFRGRDHVRVWCAGCSSGQEAYSTILCLLDQVPLDAIEVLATDYDDELLQKCRAGIYSHIHLWEIPDRYLRYVRECEKFFEFLPEVRARITIRHLNLLTDPYPEGFDVIICRNVLKFFSPDKIAELQGRLAASLAKDGFLFVSNDDHTDDLERILRPEELGLVEVGCRSIYRKR